MRPFTIAFLCIDFLLLSFQCFGQFGELPKGALFTGSMSAIKGEVGIFFPTDSLYKDNLKELRFQSWPTDSTKHVNILAIGEVDSFQLDETQLKRKLFFIYWWLPLQTSPGLQTLPNNDHFLQLKSWFSDKEVVAYYRKKGLPIGYAQVKAHFGDRSIEVEIEVDHELINISMTQPTSELIKQDYPLPAYTTIWHQDAQLQKYTLFTYYNHYMQDVGKVHMDLKGGPTNSLARQLKRASEAGTLTGELQTGWKCKFGEYQAQ